MARFPGEAGDARDATPSPGLPRGTQFDLSTTPREARRAPRADPHGRTDGSSGNRAHDSYDLVVRALADAFLAAPTWTSADLEQAGWHTLGVERAFVGLAVDAALTAHPRPPRDAPRQLAAALASSTRLAELFAARSSTRPLRIDARTAAPVEGRPGSSSRLLVDTVPDLATVLGVSVGRLLWLADTRGWNRRAAAASPLQHYRYEWLVRPGRTPRLIEKPLSLLAATQRILLADLLGGMPVHDAAHGFVPGRSAVSGAALHVGRDVVVSADLTSFFANVTATQIYGVFRRAGFAEPLAHLLAGVCTHRVPVAVLSAMPPGGSPDERFALRRALAVAHLPQGAPTSPALANLTLGHLDARLSGLASSVGATYTRYADDLTFSGDARLASRTGAFVRGVEAIVTDEGHSLNPRKTRVRRQGVRQTVTSVVVNAHTGVPRRDFDRLKAIVHNCVRFGPALQNRSGHPDFRAHLSGRIGWVEQCDPVRGARLRAEFARIVWGE